MCKRGTPGALFSQYTNQGLRKAYNKIDEKATI